MASHVTAGGRDYLLSKPDAATQARASELYGKLPLSFEANVGQTDPQVKFVSVTRNYTFFLTPTGAVLSLKKRAAPESGRSSKPEQLAAPHRQESSGARSATIRIQFLGGTRRGGPRRIQGLEQLPGKSNYFIGKDPERWHTNVPHFAKVRYEKVYPSVDVVYHGNQKELELDFVVAPGADPKSIILGLEGARKVQINSRGDLVLQTPAGQIWLRTPRIYQPREGDSPRSAIIGGRYVLKGSRQVGFEVAAYDISRPLIIDPVLSYSTYLGGSSFDQGNGIAVDVAGNVYVTGFTNSTNFPTTSGAYDTTAANADVFVSKLNPAVSGAASLLYSTYLGGSLNDVANGIAVDSSGSAYVVGQTFSSNFPTTAGAFQTTPRGRGDAFVTKFSASGSSLLYSTYLGGGDVDAGRAIDLDSSNNVYLTGFSYSTDFPTINAIQVAKASTQDADAFVAELAANGSSLVYSTYFGGSSFDRGNSITVDSVGNAWVTGFTRSADFPMAASATPFQATCSSCPTINDAFLANIGAGGSPLVYSTYLGGSGDDQATSIDVDSSGSAYITGLTSSPDFPTTTGAFQRSLGGAAAAFVTKLNVSGSGLVYSTYLGGNTLDFGQGIAVDSGNAYVTGQTMSPTFPTVNPIQATCGTSTCSNGNVFVTELNPVGSAPVFSTYLGGTGYDEGNAIAVDSSGNAYVAGDTASTTFPTKNPFRSAFGGGLHDAFMAQIVLVPAVSLSPGSLNFGNQQVGTSSTAQAVTLSNSGGASLSLTSIVASGDYSQSNTCGSALAAGANCSISVTFTPTATGTRTGAITISDNASDSPQMVNLTGTGTASSGPAVSLSPGSLNFGNQQVGTSSTAQAVTLSNSGGASLSLISIVASGDYSQSNTCGSTLAAGANCSISVTFTPTATGTRTGAITISDNASDSPQMVNLTGTGTASSGPAVSLSPGSLNFGNQQVGTSSTAQAVTLSNSGGASLSLISIVASGDYSQSNTCGSTLAAGANCSISVTFTPTATGTRTGAITISDNASDSPQMVNLTGTGTAAAGLSFVKAAANQNIATTGITSLTANVSTSANHLLVAFVAENANNTDTMQVSDSAGNPWTNIAYDSYSATNRAGMFYSANAAAVTSVTVTFNTTGGVGNAVIVVYEISGAASSSVLDGSAVAHNSVAGNSLASGSLTTTNANDIILYGVWTPTTTSAWVAGAAFTFPPGSTEGRANMDYQIVSSTQAGLSTTTRWTNSSKSSSVIAAFKADSSGAAPAVSLSPGSLNFGNQQVGTSSTAQAVTLSNSGGASLSLTSIVASGDYSQSNTCGSALAAGANCSISVTFTPTATGTRTGAITISDNASDSPQMVNLTGTGTASSGPAVSLSPGSLNFGNQQVGTSSTAQAVTLSNSGGASLSLISIVASGDYSQSNTCGSTLAAGANCSISVTFTPTATGTRTGAITISDNASDSPQMVNLTGTGTAAAGLSFVKAAANQNIATTGITSLTANVSTSANHLLVAFVAENANNTDTMQVSDSAGNPWTNIAYDSYSATNRAGMFYSANAAAVTSVTVTFNTTGGVGNAVIVVYEISGAASSSVLDGSAVAHNSVAGNSLASGSLTTTNANDIILYGVWTPTTTSAWVAGAAFTFPPGSTEGRANMDYQIVSSTQAGLSTTTRWTNSSKSSSVIAAFKADSSGAAPAVSLSPGSLNFGNQQVGASSTAQAVTLSNSEETDLLRQ